MSPIFNIVELLEPLYSDTNMSNHREKLKNNYPDNENWRNSENEFQRTKYV